MASAVFDKIQTVRGATLAYPFSFTWDDTGAARDVSGLTVYFRGYSDQGVTLLFTQKTASNGATTDVKIVSFTAADLATVGIFYCELEIAGDARWVGTLQVLGPVS